ncbi:MAG: FmdE family protein [Polaromonas sp.]
MHSLHRHSIVTASLALLVFSAQAHDISAKDTDRSPDEWIALGETVHGGFGSHIALGIRIGQDALHRLNAKRREVDVSVTEGKNAPCACVADGLVVATSASPGQKTLTVNAKSQDAAYLAVIEVKNRATGATATYRVPSSMIETLAKMNPGKSAKQRFEAVFAMPQSQLFEVSTK